MERVYNYPPINKPDIKRILIRTTNWVGDMVMSIPALEAVRENFPGSTVAALARPWVIPLLENHPAVDQVIPLMQRHGPVSHGVEIIRTASLIRRMKFDLAVLFQNAFEAALLAWLGGIRFRLGYDTDGRRFLLSHAVTRNQGVSGPHQVEYYLSLLRAVGWEAQNRDPHLYVAEKDRLNTQSLLASERIGQDQFLLGMGPGAIFGPAKRWPYERFANVADRAVREWGARVLVLGSGQEKDVCAALTRSMKQRALDLCGRTTLGEAMAVIERCDLFVTNDSGLMHIAAALNVPMVAIFGSTDPVSTGPRSEKARIVRHLVDCAPCLRSECPDNYHCMLNIEPDMVWQAMESLKQAKL